MTAPVPPAGPPCDLCGGEPAVMSVMNLADYSTVQVGPGCLAGFLEGILAEVRGPETPVGATAKQDEVEAAESAAWAPATDPEPPKAKPRTAHPRGSRRGG